MTTEYWGWARRADGVGEDEGLTQTQLAERLAFSRDYLADLEAARPTLYTTRLFRTLHELGIRLTLEYEDETQAADTADTAETVAAGTELEADSHA
jgi:HTH-type transcriptional regulator/antitoxin HipB